MIVRTYGRRTRCISRSYSDSSFNGDHEDTFTESLLPQESSQDVYSFAFSSQDSTPWSFDSDIPGSNSSQVSLPLLPPRAPLTDSSSHGNGIAPKSKKPRHQTLESKGIKNAKSSNSKGARSTPMTSTLMEAQEFGEMMEHVDEVNFALDGLRKAQPFRIRRASLLSLLSICATATQRRLLRAQGMAKAIIDAILALSLDDSPSTLAAAALFFILANDGQDEHLLDSPICIQFLLKLLSPSMITTTEDKGRTIGTKLLALCRDPGILRDQSKRLDASSTAIISKVQEILLSCKEIPSSNRDDEGLGRPELSSKWIALLTIEKACLTTVSLEDTSGTVRKAGGNFKERLRELGGLDAVFNVAVNCHSIMEGWSKHSLLSIRELKDGVALQTVVLLLKCLKIMENATFLSKDNQNHLLGMKGKLDCEGSPLSFTGLVISAIKILSGLSLLQSSSISSDNTSHSHSDCMDNAFENLLKEYPEVEQDGILSSNSSRRLYGMEKASHVKGFKISQKHQRLSDSQSVYTVSSSETTSAFTADVLLVKKEENSSTSGSWNGTSRSSNGTIPRNANNPMMSLGLGKRRNVTENSKYSTVEDSQDPFAFDEGEFVPSKWDLLSMRKEAPQISRATVREEDECQAQLMTSHHESNNGENYHSCEFTCSAAVEEGNSNLLADCLLTAVKVLMNLTNDNPVGCKQIAACGGLETLSALIIGHFPSFSSCLSPCRQTEKTVVSPKWSTELEHQNDKHFTDQELDFLVAILGLLVNLVEKDSRNRSRLAATRVPLPTPGGSKVTDSHRDVISLMCSIFLTNQGAGEAAGEGGPLPWDDEDAVLQGEREAEKMIIEAYAALLLAFLSTESKNVREAISCCLPDHSLEVLVPVLERFVAFHLTLNMISPETHKAVSEVIESCRGA